MKSNINEDLIKYIEDNYVGKEILKSSFYDLKQSIFKSVIKDISNVFELNYFQINLENNDIIIVNYDTINSEQIITITNIIYENKKS